MVPYWQLSEAARELDRVTVRAVLDAIATAGYHLEVGEAVRTVIGPPDVPCPKCGSTDVQLAHCGGRAGDANWTSCWQRGEHFDRHCRRCHFRWRTFDVLGGGS
jgi:hypothetical protein